MSVPSRAGVSLAAAMLCVITTGGAAVAQKNPSGGGLNVSLNGDSVAHVVPRIPASRASYAIVSRDGATSLLLMDTTIVIQMTDRGIDHMQRSADSAVKADTTSGGVFARMLTGAVMGMMRPLFDHGIAYHLRDLGDAQYRDGNLLLLRRNGEPALGKMDVNGRPLMSDFSPEDSREFARRARIAAARLRS